MSGFITHAAGEFPVNQIVAKDQVRPAIAQLTDGRLAAVWESHANGTAIICSRMIDTQGASLSDEKLIYQNAGQDQAYPAITALTDGGFVIAWSSRNGDGDDYSVAFEKFDSNGTPATASPEQANTLTTGPQFKPQLAPLPAGAFVVVWVAQNNGADQDIFYRRFDSGSVAMDASEIAANRLGDVPVGDGEQGHPSVAALNDGGFVVAYENREDGKVYGVRIDASGNAVDALGAAPGIKQFLLGQDANTKYTDPSIAALSNGGFVIATTASPDGLAGSREVHVRTFDTTGQGSTEFVAGSHVGHWEQPQAIGLPNGDFVVGWQATGEGDDSVTGAWSVWLQEFQPNGTPRIDPLMVNVYNTENQRRIALTGFANDGIGALWQSLGQDSDGFGIFGNTLASRVITPGQLFIRRSGASGRIFNITFIGTGGYDHVLQSSTTLAPNNWTTIATTNPPSGTFTYVDDGSTIQHKMFRAWTNP